MKRALLIVALYAICALRCEAQFIGYVSSQSVAQQVFTAQAANGSSVTVTNLGQSAHFLSYCTTGFSGTVSLQASPDGTFATPITIASAAYGQNSTTDTACHVLQAGGYFQTIRATVSNYISGSVNAWYTAIAAPIAFAPVALASNGPTSPIACDKFGVVQIAQSTNNGILVGLNGTTPKVYLCSMTISFSAATTAGAINIGDGTSGGCTVFSGVTNWQLAVTANTPQTVTFGGPLGTFTGTFTPGRCLMVTTGAITASATISFSYAQF
jgi:hypothetical protein